MISSNTKSHVTLQASDVPVLQDFISQALDTTKETVVLSSSDIQDVMRILRSINEQLNKAKGAKKGGDA